MIVIDIEAHVVWKKSAWDMYVMKNIKSSLLMKHMSSLLYWGHVEIKLCYPIEIPALPQNHKPPVILNQFEHLNMSN